MHTEGVGGVPVRLVVQALRVAAELVGLDVGLVHHINTKLVADLIPTRVVGIVGGADGVEVALLDPEGILLHLLLGHVTAAVGVHLVAVDAPQLSADAIDEELALLAHLDAAEAKLEGACVTVGEGEGSGVKVRRLGSPTGHVLDGAGGQGQLNLLAGLEGGNGELGGIDVADGHGDLGGNGGGVTRVAHPDVAGDGAGHVVIGQAGTHPDVANLQGGGGEEGHVAEDAGQAPEILVFQVGAVAPAINLDRESILAGLEGLGDVVLTGGEGVFAVADVGVVDPDVVGGLDAIEAQIDLALVEALGQGEGGAVATHGGTLLEGGPVFGRRGGHARRVNLEGINLVGIDRRAVAAHLPAHRHRDEVPLRDVVGGLPEILRTLGGGVREVEAPLAVKREDAVRRRGHQGRARRLAVHLEDGFVFPFRCREQDARAQRRQQGKQFPHDVAPFHIPLLYHILTFITTLRPLPLSLRP